MNLVRGKVIGHAKGFAFVESEDKVNEQDIFIPPKPRTYKKTTYLYERRGL
ncbi:hypothetical protein LCL95_16905 [Bacillus timonensis]|nr:hypothetical protein [Bacillus timonensis]